MPPPFNINENSPAPTSLISSFPADEQANRAEIEEWLSFISDPATGLIRPEVLPSAADTFPAGTKIIAVQTAAPTGWTKDTTHNNKALRVVNGTAGSGGSVAFTAAFTSQTPAGTIGNTTAGGTVGGTSLTTAQLPSHNHSLNLNTSNASADHTHGFSGSVSGTTGAAGLREVVGQFVAFDGDISDTSNHIRQGDDPPGSTARVIDTIPDHTHSFSAGFSGTTGASGSAHVHAVIGNTGNNGSGSTHNHTFTGTAHNHTFTGTAIDLAVQYVDVIIITKN